MSSLNTVINNYKNSDLSHQGERGSKFFSSETKLMYYKISGKFLLENGESLQSPQIAFQTFGKLNANKDNVIWVCHALTGNTDVSDWWKGIFGKGKILDTTKKFIICANILGSPYGSTNPLSLNPLTGIPYYRKFPLITIRDNVNAFELLRQKLGISKINTLIGGSIGAFHALEWSIMKPTLIENLVFIAGSAKASPWALALNESQRMAILADGSFNCNDKRAGLNGLKSARSIALLSYRGYQAYAETQDEKDNSKLSGFRANSYQQYQGEKLAQRFDAFSYYSITRTFDTHNISRGREGLGEALQKIKANTLIIGINSDLLFPVLEQKLLKQYIKNSRYAEINSIYGHDAFLIEFEQLNEIYNCWKKQIF